MEIKTKYQVGDKVCTIDRKTLKIKSFVIGNICIYVYDGRTDIGYTEEGQGIAGVSYEESLLFPSEKDLITYITTNPVVVETNK